MHINMQIFFFSPKLLRIYTTFQLTKGLKIVGFDASGKAPSTVIPQKSHTDAVDGGWAARMSQNHRMVGSGMNL